MLSRPGPLPSGPGWSFEIAARAASVLSMGDTENNVPDELEEQLDDLAEELRDPDRRDRTIEDQGEEGRIVGEDEADESAEQA